MVELAQQLTSVWRSPTPSPPQLSAMQDTTTLELSTDLWNHFTSLRSKNWHFACHLSPTPTSFTTTINIGQCICWWFDGSTTFRGNGKHPTHEVHQPILFWRSTNWPSTFCVTIQPTIFPVRHHPSSFDLAPPPSQQQPVSHLRSSSSCSALCRRHHLLILPVDSGHLYRPPLPCYQYVEQRLLWRLAEVKNRCKHYWMLIGGPST